MFLHPPQQVLRPGRTSCAQRKCCGLCSLPLSQGGLLSGPGQRIEVIPGEWEIDISSGRGNLPERSTSPPARLENSWSSANRVWRLPETKQPRKRSPTAVDWSDGTGWSQLLQQSWRWLELGVEAEVEDRFRAFDLRPLHNRMGGKDGVDQRHLLDHPHFATLGAGRNG